MGTGPLKIQRLVPRIAHALKLEGTSYSYFNVGDSFFQLQEDSKGGQTLRFLFSYPNAGQTPASTGVLKLFACAPPNSGWPDFNVSGSKVLGAMISGNLRRFRYFRAPT